MESSAKKNGVIYLLVISLVGINCSGKTSSIEILKSLGYSTFKVDYILHDTNKIDNRLTISKWYWIARWFNDVIKLSKCKKCPNLIFSDRSPIEAGIYSESCYNLLPGLLNSFKELYLFNNIDCKHIYLRCKKKILLKRINKRLKYESIRRNYNEDNQIFLNKLFKNYEKNINLWDFILDTSELKQLDVALEIIRISSNLLGKGEK